MAGAFLLDLDRSPWPPFWHLTAVTGLAMALLYLGAVAGGRWRSRTR